MCGAETSGDVSTTSDGSLPAITGTCVGGYGSDRARTGAYTGTWRTADSVGAGHDLPAPGQDSGWEIKFDASKSSNIYWRTDNKVFSRNIKVYFVIKY